MRKSYYRTQQNSPHHIYVICEKVHKSEIDEKIGKHRKYEGRRVKRGLFRSSKRIEINTDCNGAGNIGRKVFPKTFVNGIVDIVSYPSILTIQK